MRLLLVPLLLAGCSPCARSSASPAVATTSEVPFGGSPDEASQIGEVTIDPVLAGTFFTIEHFDGQLTSMGDALGRDCVATELLSVDGRTWSRPYRTDGATNEDWVGWHKPVLAPINGTVVKVNDNPLVNAPGSYPRPSAPASFIVLRDDSGLLVILAHLDNIAVHAGDLVKRGQAVAVVGNRGSSWHPHVHVGAWRGTTPLQVRFDLAAMRRLQSPAFNSSK